MHEKSKLKMETKINISFHRRKYSMATCEFLCAKLDEERDKEIITNIRALTNGTMTKMKVKEANAMAIRIVQAIIIDDDLEEFEETMDTETEGESDSDRDNGDETIKDETSTQVEKAEITVQDPVQSSSTSVFPLDTNAKSKGKKHYTSQDNPIKPIQEKVTPDQRETCRFYTRGKCRHGTECRFNHPKICNKFRNFGSKKQSEKGCDSTSCGQFHPNACRDSLKSRTCQREECRFFHLKGTKTIKIQNMVQNQPGPSNRQHKKQKQGANQRQHTTEVKTSNRFEGLQDTGRLSQPVFYKEPNSLETTLAMIMKKLTNLEDWQDKQNARAAQKKNSSSPDWRSRDPEWPSQEQRNQAWDSQRRANSQRSDW